MSYVEGFTALKKALESCSIRHSVDKATSTAEAQFIESVFGSETASSIARVGYIGNVEFPWVVETFYLYALNDLPNRQAGYRSDQASPANGSGRWPDQHFVIGDWAADPISINTGSLGSIHASRHGRGSWTFGEISQDLGKFLHTMSKWLTYFVINRDGAILNSDFEVDETEKAQIRRVVLDELDPELAERFLQFLIP